MKIINFCPRIFRGDSDKSSFSFFFHFMNRVVFVSLRIAFQASSYKVIARAEIRRIWRPRPFIAEMFWDSKWQDLHNAHEGDPEFRLLYSVDPRAAGRTFARTEYPYSEETSL